VLSVVLTIVKVNKTSLFYSEIVCWISNLMLMLGTRGRLSYLKYTQFDYLKLVQQFSYFKVKNVFSITLLHYHFNLTGKNTRKGFIKHGNDL
jgi:hypothetical protein